jgi:DNA-binding beta-propeller fold protein YncE
MKRSLAMAAASLAVLFFSSLTPAGQSAPSFQVDPLWPKPLPNHWLLGSVTGVTVDSRDHIWIVHRGYDSMTARTEIGAATSPKTSEECCVPAPPVLEFDTAGNLVSHWGGPGEKYEWPVSPGGIAVDSKGSVWITAAGPPEIPGSANASAGRGRAGGTGAAGAGRAVTGGGAAEGGGTIAVTPAAGQPAAAAGAAGGQGRAGGGGGGGRGNAPPKPTDAHVLKFSRTGEFLLQIGKAGTTGDNASTTALNRPAGVDLDPSGGEVYVADGFVNQRVVVFDAATGAYKRQISGSGEAPLKTVSCAKVAKDGTVYVCDRGNNRVQAFDKNGKFVKQGVVSPETKGTGSVWDIALSRDPQQRYLYVADGHDQKIFILRRDTLETVGSFGDGGRYPGTFYSVGSIAVDSRGNIYTGENLEGKRVQKFMPKGATR